MNNEQLKKLVTGAATVGVYAGLYWLLMKNEDPGILHARILLGSAKACQAIAGFFGGVGIELEKAYNTTMEAAKS